MTNEELVYLYQQGHKEALERLAEQNKRIIYKLANRYYTEGTSSIDKEDLIQEGYLGLIAAADKYDPDNEKKAQFLTYAIYWINQKMSRFVRTRCTNEETSLNTPIGDEGDSELMDYIEGVDYGFENVEEQLYIKQLREELDQVMNQYNTLKEREIIKLHYGWDTNKEMPLTDIGEIFDITKERIRQIESRALGKIRRSSWGERKAKEMYVGKKLSHYRSVSNAVESISFAERYLV